MTRHLSQDLTADLAAELRVDPPPALPSPGPPSPASPAPATQGRGTPALSVLFTPLRWSRPSVARAGRVLTLRLGPWRAELSA